MKLSKLIEIRIPAHLTRPLREAVTFGYGRESVVFALASHSVVGDKTLVLVRKVLTLPDEAYVPNSGHGAKWLGSAMVPILNEALAGTLGVVLFHSHPHRGRVALSSDDVRSARALLPVFQNLVPDRPHASVVFGDEHAAGLVLMPGTERYNNAVKLRWVDKVITDLTVEDAGVWPASEEGIYHRQELVIGSRGQNRLSRAKVGVVGLGGGGSQVVQQLAHIGIGEIIGIDGDRVERSNRSRLIGMTALDVLVRRRKTGVMKRMVRRINRGVKFTRIPFPMPDKRAVEALKGVDAIAGCLDTLHSRADVQDLSWRYLIPYVDIGVLIQPTPGGSGVTIGGHVATLIPGEFCQWCIDILSDEKLKRETGGRPRSYFQDTAKQAQVVSFNGVLASQAVSEVLQLFTGFAPIENDSNFKKFDGLKGTLEQWGVKKQTSCRLCSFVLGVGDVVWRSA